MGKVVQVMKYVRYGQKKSDIIYGCFLRQTSSKVLKPKTANSTAQITLLVKELADRGKTDMIDGAFCDKISVSLT